MTSNQSTGAFLRRFDPFNSLSEELALAVEPLIEIRRYRLGQTLLRPEVLPEGVLLIHSGELRNLGPDPSGQGLRTIERLGAGSVIGWAGILRQEPCEHIRATSEIEAQFLPSAAFRDLLAGNPSLSGWFQANIPAAELHHLLVALVEREPQWQPLLESWPAVQAEVRISSLIPGPAAELALSPQFSWFVSSGDSLASAWLDKPLLPLAASAAWLRLVGLPNAEVQHGSWFDSSAPLQPNAEMVLQIGSDLVAAELRADDDYSSSPEPASRRAEGRGGVLALGHASGSRDISIAVCRCLADYFGLPINLDSLRDQIDAVLQRQQQLNLINLGQILDSIGLRVMLSKVPADRLYRVPTPAILMQHGHIGVLDGVDSNGDARLLEAELGPLKVPCRDLVNLEGGLVELLLFQRKADAKEQKFDFSWYLPYLKKHKRALVEVLFASAAINVLMLATPLGFMLLINTASQRNIGSLLSISFLMIIAGLIVALVKVVRSYIFTETANRIDQEAKATILDQLVRLPQGFFDSRPVGQITFYFNQLDRLREFLVGQTPPLLIDTAFSLVYFIILFSISPLLTLVVISTVPLMVALTLASNPIVYSQIKRTMAESMRTHSFLTEVITGIQTIKSQNAELKTSWEFQNRYARYLGEDFKLRISRETLSNLGQFIQQFSGLLVIGVGIWLVMQGQINIGDIIAFRILDSYITGPLVKLADTWLQFQTTRQQMRMVADVVDRNPEQTNEESLNIPMPPLQGRVQFVDIAFRFNEDAPLVIEGINLEVPAGSFVGLVGGSGSGKSTLLKLLPRFYRPSEGKVLMDGLDINKLELYSLRRQIGVVPQDSLLFDGTIRDNLLMVKPDASADELIHAARIACAHDFIMEMPKGYNSSVGERGAGLSGGQRQRLALARAVLQNPRMLILDEATSALDARTERQVCINLFEAFRGRTVFFITHRLTTVKPADFIIVMDRGAVMEIGSHKQLIAQQGWYYALYQSQNQEGIT